MQSIISKPGVVAIAVLATILPMISCQNSTSPLEVLPLALNEDESFNFQLLIALGLGVYEGASPADVLAAARVITPGSFSSFNTTFYQLAQRSQKNAKVAQDYGDERATQENNFFAASYYRNADFYLHGNWSDPLIDYYWNQQTECFNRAIATLPVPGERVFVQADGFQAIGIFYAADNSSCTKRPTLLVGNGYDGGQEDSFHQIGFAALERGWNVMTYEGPGQPTVRRDQNLGFIPDWENVVTPVVSYLASRPDVDMSRLALNGISLGGYLAFRAAAFEPRIKALILNDGVWSAFDSFTQGFPPFLLELFDSGNKTEFDMIINEAVLFNESAPTAARWGIGQGLWSFNTHSPFEWLTMGKLYTVANITQNIQIPTWVGNPVNDADFPGQAVKVANALGSKATLHTFTGAASYHCEVGAFVESNWAIFEWLDGVFGRAT